MYQAVEEWRPADGYIGGDYELHKPECVLPSLKEKKAGRSVSPTNAAPEKILKGSAQRQSRKKSGEA